MNVVHTGQRSLRLRDVWLGLFPIAALLISWLSSSTRNGLEVANVALVLAIITLIAGSVRSDVGIVTSLVAAGSLNYFHTTPVHSFNITDKSDLLMVALLLTLGFVVSAITAQRVRRSVRQIHSENVRRSKETILQLLEAGLSVDDAWNRIVATLAHEFALLDATLITDFPSNLPVIGSRTSRLSDSDELIIPESGAVAEFADPRIGSGLLLMPRRGLGPVTVSRSLVWAFLDQVERFTK